MTRFTRATTAVTIAVAALALAACGPDDVASPPSSSTASQSTSLPSSPTSGTSSATTSLSPSDAAGQAVVHFWAVLDKVNTDPSSSINDIDTVARDQAANTWKQITAAQRAKQLVQVGRTVVAVGSSTPSNGGTYTVTACLDMSKVNVVDSEGKSVVAADRAPRVQYTFVVASSSDGLFVVKDEVVGTC